MIPNRRHTCPRKTTLHWRDSFVSLEGFLNAKLMVAIIRRLSDQPVRERLSDAAFAVRNFASGIEERVSFGPDQSTEACNRSTTPLSNRVASSP